MVIIIIVIINIIINIFHLCSYSLPCIFSNGVTAAFIDEKKGYFSSIKTSIYSKASSGNFEPFVIIRPDL